jgi:hypothetical protein
MCICWLIIFSELKYTVKQRKRRRLIFSPETFPQLLCINIISMYLLRWVNLKISCVLLIVSLLCSASKT